MSYRTCQPVIPNKFNLGTWAGDDPDRLIRYFDRVLKLQPCKNSMVWTMVGWWMMTPQSFIHSSTGARYRSCLSVCQQHDDVAQGHQ